MYYVVSANIYCNMKSTDVVKTSSTTTTKMKIIFFKFPNYRIKMRDVSFIKKKLTTLNFQIVVLPFANTFAFHDTSNPDKDIDFIFFVNILKLKEFKI